MSGHWGPSGPFSPAEQAQSSSSLLSLSWGSHMRRPFEAHLFCLTLHGSF